MDGITYEHCCGEIFPRPGLSVVISPASTDRGVNILMPDHRRIVAIQRNRVFNPGGRLGDTGSSLVPGRKNLLLYTGKKTHDFRSDWKMPDQSYYRFSLI